MAHSFHCRLAILRCVLPSTSLHRRCVVFGCMCVCVCVLPSSAVLAVSLDSPPLRAVGVGAPSALATGTKQCLGRATEQSEPRRSRVAERFRMKAASLFQPCRSLFSALSISRAPLGWGTARSSVGHSRSRMCAMHASVTRCVAVPLHLCNPACSFNRRRAACTLVSLRVVLHRSAGRISTVFRRGHCRSSG